MVSLHSNNNLADDNNRFENIKLLWLSVTRSAFFFSNKRKRVGQRANQQELMMPKELTLIMSQGSYALIFGGGGAHGATSIPDSSLDLQSTCGNNLKMGPKGMCACANMCDYVCIYVWWRNPKIDTVGSIFLLTH